SIVGSITGTSTQTIITSGSGTYTPPSLATRLRIRMTGGGGGGGGAGGSATTSGAGGGAGGYIEFVLNSPTSSLTYSIGTGGNGGSAGGGDGTTGNNTTITSGASTNTAFGGTFGNGNGNGYPSSGGLFTL